MLSLFGRILCGCNLLGTFENLLKAMLSFHCINISKESHAFSFPWSEENALHTHTTVAKRESLAFLSRRFQRGKFISKIHFPRCCLSLRLSIESSTRENRVSVESTCLLWILGGNKEVKALPKCAINERTVWLHQCDQVEEGKFS